jgi:hypothetical protein
MDQVEEAKGLTDFEIVKQVEEYFFQNDELANKFETFVQINAGNNWLIFCS